MSTRVILFDVIETVFSLRPLKARLEAEGLPEGTAELFFAQLLRDAFALSATGIFKPFPEIAAGTLRVLLESHWQPVTDDVIRDILSVFGKLPAHSDVRGALEAARAANVRSVLLTNGSRANTEKLVSSAGLTDLVDDVISVEDVEIWKPRSGIYQHAARKCGVEPADATLIAAHAWDVHGALQAGLNAVWVKRQDASFHPLMGRPRALADSLPEAVTAAL